MNVLITNNCGQDLPDKYICHDRNTAFIIADLLKIASCLLEVTDMNKQIGKVRTPYLHTYSESLTQSSEENEITVYDEDRWIKTIIYSTHFF